MFNRTSSVTSTSIAPDSIMCSKLFSGQLQAVVSSTLAEVTMKRVTAPSLLLLVAISSMAQQPRFDGKSWWHHVEVLAADDMEGRATGSPGLQRAEAYVVD